jgi:SNF2 family DNA or RNA helicase
MGLGKTIQVVALLASPEREHVAPSLVIAPSTLLENWRREIAKFAPTLRTYIHQGSQRTGDFRELLQKDVVITSYDTAVRDSSMLRMIEWPIVVLDEAQAIKNPDTKRAVSVKKLKRKVGIAVTGTPIENRLRDLWSILDFCIPGYLGDEASFEQQFSDDLTGAASLEPLVSPVLLRRKVSEVAQDLPPRIDIPQALTLSEIEAEEYERIRQETIAEYGGNATLVALGRLRMFCAHPMLLDSVPWTTARALTFGKFQRLFEIADEVFENRQKMLVFTSYNRMAELIRQTVRERYGFFAEVINGDTLVPERQVIVDRFSQTPGAALLALNPKAAGTGLNITAATHVVHYNLEWNPAVEDQASARAYRRGQQLPVTIHRLFYADTVEEAVDDRLSRKRLLSKTAVVGVEGAKDDYADIVRALQASPARRTHA